MCRVISCVVGRGCLLWPVCSLGKILLAFALLHFVLQGQTCCCLGISWLLGIPDQLTCLLRKLYVDQETTVRTKHGTTDWFNIGKVVCQVCMVSPYLHYVKYRLDESQAGIKIAWRNINNLRYTDDTTLMAESKEELKSLLMNEKGEWKSWLKSQYSKTKDHGIWSPHFMANREKLETMTNFILRGSKITANGERS